MEQNALLRVNNLVKKYPGVVALNGVSFELLKGEVLAIVGENGAGKSTLIKALTGAIKPTSGDIEYDGVSYSELTPDSSLEKGITAIYQEFNLINYLTTGENIFFGNEPLRRGFIDKKRMYKEASEVLARTGVDVPIKTQVSKLGTSQHQIIEIAKALSRDSKILIMDEPSAALTNREVKILHGVVRRLQSEGVSIIYISHKLEETFELADRVIVLRDGNVICEKKTSELTRRDLIRHMVGRHLTEQFPQTCYEGGECEEVLRVENLSNRNVHNISFSLYEGEILGIGGLVGSGRTELLRAIFGADPYDSGQVYIKGRAINKKTNQSIKAGLGFLPEDRKEQGLFLGMSVKDNISFASMKYILRKTGLIHFAKERKRTAKYISDLDIKTPSQRQLARNLSGGNQQKVVLAKWLSTNSDIYIFDEPTRGIDVNTKHEIYEIMRKLTQMKKSILMVSSEMPELIGMSDRVIVMASGHMMGILENDEIDQERIMQLASQKPEEQIDESSQDQ